MSAPEKSGTENADTAIVARLLDLLTETVIQVLESMTDQRPLLRWESLDSPPEVADEADILWWEQPLQISPDAKVWVAAPKTAWEHIGTLTLRAAGLDTVAIEEARSTWFEILGQSLSGMARGIGAILGVEVNCEAGAEKPAGPDVRSWARLSMTLAETPLAPLYVAFSSGLIAVVSAPPPIRPDVPAGDPDAGVRPPAGRADEGAESPVVRSRTMDLLLDVDLPVSISFGKTLLPMKDIIKLTTGSIIELNRGVNDPVEVLVNQCLIARGEVVVVDGNYGVRIAQIASRKDRLRSLR